MSEANLRSLCRAAEAAIGRTFRVRNNLAYYYADEIRAWVRVTRRDLRHAPVAREVYGTDAYSHWCAETSVTEISAKRAAQLGL